MDIQQIQNPVQSYNIYKYYSGLLNENEPVSLPDFEPELEPGLPSETDLEPEPEPVNTGANEPEPEPVNTLVMDIAGGYKLI